MFVSKPSLYKLDIDIDISLDKKKPITEIPYVDLPEGTLLFRGINLPDSKKGDNNYKFYSDFLGIPSDDSPEYCLNPTTNVFFYTCPYVSFGAHRVGEKYNAIQVYVANKNLRVVNMVAPSQWTRGTPNGLNEKSPIQRCDKIKTKSCDIESKKNEEGVDTKKFDNCIDPLFAQKHGFAGWMAIGSLDSLNYVFPDKKNTVVASDTTMGQYLIALNKRHPDRVTELLPLITMDTRRIPARGFEEVVLFPWSPHPGVETQITEIRDEDDIIYTLAAKSENLNYLPLACITQNGVLDALSGEFRESNLPIISDTLSSEEVRIAIEKNLTTYLDELDVGRLVSDEKPIRRMFDTRTGMYVIERFIYQGDVEKGVSYSSLLMPIRSIEEKKNVIEYQTRFRNYINNKYMLKVRLEDNTTEVRRANIFNRPNLGEIYNQLNIKPSNLIEHYIRESEEQGRKNNGSKKFNTRKFNASTSKKFNTRKQFYSKKGGGSNPILFESFSKSNNHVLTSIGNVYKELWKTKLLR